MVERRKYHYFCFQQLFVVVLNKNHSRYHFILSQINVVWAEKQCCNYILTTFGFPVGNILQKLCSSILLALLYFQSVVPEAFRQAPASNVMFNHLQVQDDFAERWFLFKLRDLWTETVVTMSFANTQTILSDRLPAEIMYHTTVPDLLLLDILVDFRRHLLQVTW